MRKILIFPAISLFMAACAVPDVKLVDSFDDGGEPSSDDGGESSQGGSKNPDNGGAPSIGGQPSGGSGPTNPSGGSGGSGPSPLPAVAKFCNDVSIDNQSVEYELLIGTGSKQVSIIASSGACEPVVLDDCTTIPTGGSVPLEVIDYQGLSAYTDSLPVAAGDAFIFAVYYDADEDAVRFGGQTVTAQECAAADYDPLFTDGTTPP
jgi:hypothetical protein